MSVGPGTRLGPFEIVAAIGAGGMGEVFRARDTKLNRDVAIKVLPAEFAKDHERVARFKREAQILASLNHPNIATVHGLEEDDSTGTVALAIEFVEGEDLAQRLARGPIPIDDAIAIARQIAEGLEDAHEHGIIHRDLKPANIKVTPEGRVKILDFGLAKAMEGNSASPFTSQLSHSPTMSRQMTEAGVIMGTAAYMSPEQAKGRTVDRRADIWAFGVVLFEMLSGRRLFAGESVSDTLASVIKDAVKWDLLPSEVPAAVQRLLRRCLEKDPRKRLSAIGDARLDLDEQEAPSQGRVDRVARRPVALISLAIIMTLVAISFALIFAAQSKGQAPTGVTGAVQLPVFLPDNVWPGGVAVSPDGRHIAFAAAGGSGGGIWIRSLDSNGPRPLPGGEGGIRPFWSPDSRSIAFLTIDGKLRRIDVGGGAPLDLADAAPAGVAWSPDGVILFSDGHRFLQVPASGGTTSPLAVEDGAGKDADRGFPEFLRDGRRFLYVVKAAGRPDDRAELRVGSLDAPETTLIPGVTTLPVAYSRNGDLFFMRGSMLMAQRFDEKNLALVGEPRPVTPDASPATLNARIGSFSASTNGVLAYVTRHLGSNGQLTWFDRAGKAIGSIASPQGDEFLNPSLSPDARRLAVNRMDAAGNWDIWVVDLETRITSRLTTDPAQDSDAVWSPDGNDIAFVSNRGGQWGIYRKALRKADDEQLLVKTSEEPLLSDWSRSGLVVYSLGGNILALPLAGASPAPLKITDTPFFENAGRVSPDGKWIAYLSQQTGVGEIFLQPFPGPGPKTQLSSGRGLHPRWRGDGRELIYWGNDQRLMSVDIRYDAEGVHASAPKFLLPPEIRVLTLVDTRSHYALTPDGQRFLIRQPLGPAGPPINVVLNWTEWRPR